MASGFSALMKPILNASNSSGSSPSALRDHAKHGGANFLEIGQGYECVLWFLDTSQVALHERLCYDWFAERETRRTVAKATKTAPLAVTNFNTFHSLAALAVKLQYHHRGTRHTTFARTGW